MPDKERAGQETRWRKPQKVVLCEPLGEGKLCIRGRNYGMCGKTGDPREALIYYDKKSKKNVKIDARDGEYVNGCPIAAYYLLRRASSEWEGGEFRVSESVNGRQLRIQNKEGDNITVNNGFVEGSEFAKEHFFQQKPDLES